MGSNRHFKIWANALGSGADCCFEAIDYVRAHMLNGPTKMIKNCTISSGDFTWPQALRDVVTFVP
jgi:hypothetical protein